MSEWQNVGVNLRPGFSDIPTKAALKRLFADTPENAHLYSTDAIGPNRDKTWFGDNLVIGVKYSVTGPNPYTSRKWYATIEKLPNGKITVK